MVFFPAMAVLSHWTTPPPVEIGGGMIGVSLSCAASGFDRAGGLETNPSFLIF